MEKLKPTYFFNLENYQHSSIFDCCNFVWEALKIVEKYLLALPLGKIEVDVPQGAYLINPEQISIGKDSQVEPGAYIKGPCFIGENCTIRHGAYIRGNFLCGDHCVIGHDTEIKNSIFLNEVRAGHFAYLGDSILGNDVNLGAGTKCANLKFDDGEITISLNGKLIKTGLRKFGAVLGDKAQTGCNSVTNPGTLFGKNVISYPCVNVGGFISENQVIKPTQKPIISSYHNTKS